MLGGGILVGAGPPSAIAAEPPAAIIVFDGSASMWGNPANEKKSKLALARDALKGALDKAPPGLRLGLVSFGHRRGGDCSDVESQVKAAAGTAGRINGILEKYNPRGRGPITLALREAAKDLGPVTAPASVILIHDDPDNCQADPCAALGDLQKAHPKVVVHVVSLAMKREDVEKMACLTRATGGSLVEAGNLQQINAAIEAALRAAGAGAALPQPSPAVAARVATAETARPPAAPTTPGLQLTASLGAGGPPIAAALRWRVLPAGQPEAAPLHESDAAAPFIKLAPGRYDIEAQLGFVVARTTVQLAEGEARAVVLALGAGSVQLSDAAPPAGLLRDAVLTFTRAEAGAESVSLLRGIVPEITLAAGNYIIAVTAGALRIERPVSVKAGERTRLDPLLSLGELELQVVAGAGGPVVDGVLTTIFEDDPDAPLGRREIGRSAALQPVFVLPAGTYYAVVHQGVAEARERVSVRPGERTQRVLSLETAQLAVTVRLPGRLEGAGVPVLRLQPLDPSKAVLLPTRGGSVFDVPASRYKLTGRLGQGNVLLERDIDLKAGAREQVLFEPAAGILKLRLLDPSGSAALPDATWEVRDRSGRVVWSGSETEARPLLLQGRYNVKAEARGRRVVRDVEVRAGETRAIDLGGQ